MKVNLTKSQIERFSRQLVLKNIGADGQKKILPGVNFVGPSFYEKYDNELLLNEKQLNKFIELFLPSIR